MILHDIWTVASKELRACFTDKIILMQMIILPFAIVFGYGMLMGIMADANISDDGTCNACVINAPDFMEDAFKKLGIKTSGYSDGWTCCAFERFECVKDFL